MKRRGRSVVLALLFLVSCTRTSPHATSDPAGKRVATAARTTTEPMATSTSEPVPLIPSLEHAWSMVKDADIPSLCEHPPSVLHNGRDLNIPDGAGRFELNRRLRSGWPAIVTNVPSDAGPLVAVVATCDAGGVSWPNQIVFFSSTGSFYASTDLFGSASNAHDSLWDTEGLDGPARDGVVTMTAGGAGVGVEVLAESPNGASCCPHGAATVTFHPAGGRIIVDRVVRVPAG